MALRQLFSIKEDGISTVSSQTLTAVEYNGAAPGGNLAHETAGSGVGKAAG